MAAPLAGTIKIEWMGADKRRRLDVFCPPVPIRTESCHGNFSMRSVSRCQIGLPPRAEGSQSDVITRGLSIRQKMCVVFRKAKANSAKTAGSHQNCNSGSDYIYVNIKGAICNRSGGQQHRMGTNFALCLQDVC